MGKSKVLKHLIFCIALAVIIALAHSWTGTYAEEYDELEYKTVNSFDDLFEQLETDYTFVSIPRDDLLKSGSDYEKIWYFDISEPGWFIISTYNNDGDLGYWVYNNSMFTSLNEYIHIDQKLGGDIYYDRLEDICYVTSGRYYYKIKNVYTPHMKKGDMVRRIRFFFLPASAALNIDKITYNDDYSLATVEFTPISDKIKCLKLYDMELKNLSEMHTDGTHCILRRSWLSDITDTNIVNSENSISDYLSTGFEIKKNGTYSIEIEFSDDEYASYHVAVPFVVDKIGTEAAKIETKSVKLSSKKANLKVGDTITLKATLKPKNATDKTVTWKTSNKKVATVDENGVVTAKKKGTCVITATSSNGKRAKCKITVKK